MYNDIKFLFSQEIKNSHTIWMQHIGLPQIVYKLFSKIKKWNLQNIHRKFHDVFLANKYTKYYSRLAILNYVIDLKKYFVVAWSSISYIKYFLNIIMNAKIN